MFLDADGRLTETGQISRCPAGCSRWWVRRLGRPGRGRWAVSRTAPTDDWSERVSHGRGSVLLWRRSDTLCTSGKMDDAMFAHKTRLLDVAAQLKRSARAALGLAINCAQQCSFIKAVETAKFRCVGQCGLSWQVIIISIIIISIGDARETSYLFQRISIMLQRFNSVLLHDTLPVDLSDL